MADRALFVVPGLTREIAEIATVLDALELPVRLAAGPAAGVDELRRAFAGMRFAADPIDPFDPVRFRDELEGWSVTPRDGPTRVPIDHAFPVKGVGAVALGVVRGGPLRAHERLRLYPEEREVEVRSVQVHDVDVTAAATGDRVGVALKGIEADELARGQVLAPAGSLTATAHVVGSPVRRCRYYRRPLAVGDHLHLSVGLQFTPVVIEHVDTTTIALEADRPLALAGGEPAVLADLSAGAGPRTVAGFPVTAATEHT